MKIQVQSFKTSQSGVSKVGMGVAALALLLTACAKEQDVNAFVDPTIPADQTYNDCT